MFDGTNYNSPCSFAEEIVEYIYDEMNSETKAKFETHLAKCSSCADELAGFGIVRSQVSDWKMKEFSPMKTPLIELPIVQTGENTKVKRRWFDSLRDLVMLSPAWMTQTAAFAGLLLCFGLAFYAVNYQSTEVNVVPPETFIASATPKPVPTPPVKVSPTPVVETVDSTTKNGANPPSKPAVTVVKTALPSQPKKVVVQAVQTEPKPIVVPKNKPNRQTKQAPNRQKQSDVNLLTNEDDEDDSLRLSDLFEEVSMK